MRSAIVSLKKVSYRYPHATEMALEGIDLDIFSGDFVAIVGANGSGKSTLARLLNGLSRPALGEVIIAGMSTADEAGLDRIRETVGMVFQNPESQIVATSVEDDIAFGLENLGIPADEIDDRVVRAARIFGVEDLLKKEPHWLSGGQKQRTVLAGVVALEPRVLVLDEPTSMLDPHSQREFLDLVESLNNEGVTILYITHIMEEAARAPRLVALSRGRIAFDGPPAAFFPDRRLVRDTGLLPPLPVRLTQALKERGEEIPGTPLTISELAEAVCAWE